uniref:Na+/H+ antiporter n=1 Tax=Anisakis simplex TaxID=6269 RepID=A0A0M3K3U6_ANISI
LDAQEILDHLAETEYSYPDHHRSHHVRNALRDLLDPQDLQDQKDSQVHKEMLDHQVTMDRQEYQDHQGHKALKDRPEFPVTKDHRAILVKLLTVHHQALQDHQDLLDLKKTLRFQVHLDHQEEMANPANLDLKVLQVIQARKVPMACLDHLVLLDQGDLLDSRAHVTIVHRHALVLDSYVVDRSLKRSTLLSIRLQ